MICLKTLFCSKNISPNYNINSLYNISIKSISNEDIDLSQFKGKFILFVNVASKCGFTPQYKELEQLYNTYKNKLIIIGCPCNQFGSQEPGKSQDIKTFCQVNYGVSFIITEKIDVKGTKQHPLYNWLTKKSNNNKINSSVKWNFQKYLVSPKGELIDYFSSITRPLSNKITKHLN
ncbi:glutathione peroxidase [Neotamlana laminarinivorans]|uniref:Glutathione peroxidase n=1 Tax=Neotamlana laminarinivorans TaxID=2883124 RepID=A0A9X1L2D3_9FLAO|nr:glutathione peroxidase [Tamlana laminarinivorans]MCB4797444.1 glutathione peroxidase [Tamlana laminarinivorans]